MTLIHLGKSGLRTLRKINNKQQTIYATYIFSILYKLLQFQGISQSLKSGSHLFMVSNSPVKESRSE